MSRAVKSIVSFLGALLLARLVALLVLVLQYLEWIRDLGMPLLSVKLVEWDEANSERSGSR